MTEKKKARIAQLIKADIYPVITSEFCAGRSPVDVLKAVADGGARIIQLREKTKSGSELLKLAEKFREITAEYAMLFIMNDDIETALACEADGVHLGQDDTPLAKAREIAPDIIIGISTHSPEEAREAQSGGADYINIGPLFATGTKKLPMQPLGIEKVKEIASLINIPFTVMGGIKSHHISMLAKIGIKRIAMVTEITKSDDITAKVRDLRRQIIGSDE